MSFKDTHSFEERTAEAVRILMKYPERIPIIVQKHKVSDASDLPQLEKSKFLVPENITYGQFLYIIRTRIKLPPEQALFLFINNKLPSASADMRVIYEENKDEDNFLYCYYSSESTFGN